MMGGGGVGSSVFQVCLQVKNVPCLKSFVLDDEYLGSRANDIYNELNLLSFRLQPIQLLLTGNTNYLLCTHLNHRKAINFIFPSLSLKIKKHNKTTILRKNCQIIRRQKCVLLYPLKNCAVRTCTAIYFH